MRVLLLLSRVVLIACGDDGATVQGYVEGEYLRLGLPAAGRVVAVAVAKGDRVRAGDPVFSLDDRAERAAVAEARARYADAIDEFVALQFLFDRQWQALKVRPFF